MLFSVILPIYNVEKYLEECVQSLLNQDFDKEEYEIILVDDGSKDSSPEICDRLAKEYSQIKVLHKPNGGLSDARNAGTKIAAGEYIVYVDSDDFVLSNDFFAKLSKKAVDSPDLIFYKYQKYFDDTKKMDKPYYSYASAMSKNTYAEKIESLVKADAFYGMAWIKAIKKSIIVDNNIEFEVGLLGEDMEWNYHIIFNSHSISFIDEAFIAYRQREGSITATHKIKNLTDFIYVLEKWSTRIKNECEDEQLKIALYGSLAKYYSNLFVIYSRLDDKSKLEQKSRIKALDWVLKYSMSKRPQMVAKIYKLFGFEITMTALNFFDKIK